jgi:hypothetical protein
MRTEALIAGALAAVSPILVWYSQGARAYSLFVLLTAVALLFFVRLLVEFRTPALIGWSIACAATLLTHYFALFTVAGMAAVLVYRHRARWRWIALSLLPTALTGVALLPTVAAQRSSQGQDWIAAISLQERLLQVPEHFLTGFTYPPLPVVLVAGLLAAAGGLALLVQDQPGKLVGGSLIGVVAASVGLPLLAIAATTDFVNSRNLIAAIPALFLTVGVGLGASRLRPAGPIIGLALAGLLAGIRVTGEFDHEVERPAWGEVAQAIAEDGDADLVIACCGTLAAPATHYLERFEDSDSYEVPVGELQFKHVVVATISNPDRRPTDDFCWWGAPCQADDAIGSEAPLADPRALSHAFSLVFDRGETLTRGSIRVERYDSASPVSLGEESRVHLQDGAVVVGDDVALKGVEVLVSPSLAQ